jgi:hypothetical protein
MMTDYQRYIARHTLGLPNDNKRSYRNRFYASEAHPAFDTLREMVAAGLALEEKATRHMRLFWLTDKGANAALLPGESLDAEDFPQ